MKKLFCFILIFDFIFIFSQSFNGPESVEFDFANNRWLIGNKNNGTVIARDLNGNFSPFASGMTSGPYGIEILGNTIYCCYGGGKIRGFDLNNGAQVFDLNLNATFLNGICSDGVSNLYVTDFTAKKIYRVDVNTSSFNVYVTGLTKSPNGIIHEGTNQRLVFVTWGSNASIQQVALSDSSVTTLATTTLSNIDGIAADAYGNYYVSTWGNNSIRKFSNNFSTGPSTVITGLSSPADLFYNQQNDTLAIPNSGTLNNVVWFGFGSTLNSEVVEEDKSKIKIYPIPSLNGEFTIVTSERLTLIKIFTPEGKEVFSAQVKNQKNSEFGVNSHLGKGNYLIKLYGEGINKTQQISITE